MKRKQTHLLPILAVALIVVGVVGLMWSFLPAKTETSETILQVIRVPLSPEVDSQDGVLMTPYTVLIESPALLKQGAEAELRFSLIRSTIALPLTATDNNIYDTHNVMIELRPELTDLTLTPLGSVSTAILEGQEVSMTWKILSRQTGPGEGTLWCYLVFYPLDQTQEVQRTAFIIKPLNFTTQAFLGLNVRWTAVLAAASLTAGIFIIFPLIMPNQSGKKRKQNNG